MPDPTLTNVANELDKILLATLKHGGDVLKDAEEKPVLDDAGNPIRVFPANFLQAVTARLKNCGIGSAVPNGRQSEMGDRMDRIRAGVAGRIGVPPVSDEPDAAVG